MRGIGKVIIGILIGCGVLIGISRCYGLPDWAQPTSSSTTSQSADF